MRLSLNCIKYFYFTNKTNRLNFTAVWKEDILSERYFQMSKQESRIESKGLCCPPVGEEGIVAYRAFFFTITPQI